MTDDAQDRIARRTLLRTGLAAAALAALPRSLRGLSDSVASVLASERPYLDAAQRAERWIRASRIRTEHGAVWPSDPRDTKTTQLDLYNGWPGVVLFYLELHNATRDSATLAEARAGADELLAKLASEDAITGTGLYEGAMGIAFVLAETHAATGDVRYRDGARRALDIIERRAQTVGDGVEWSDTTDIISGSAGVGLGLLYLQRKLGEQRALALATRAGRRLVTLGIPDGDGLKWAMTPTYRTQMPNFSHGTAGVSYFLTELYSATGDRAFLNAATAGARYLQRIATCANDGCAVFHHTGDGEQLYYLGWCHGPVGTARLFYRLGQVSKDKALGEWAARGARALTASGIPEQRTPGFWNNVSVCCGDAGVADFFLQWHRVQKDAASLVFAKRMTADILARATDDEQGLRWVQAEHRVRPELLVAQTGYMQGAAGIGSVLLRFDGLERSRATRVVWPDSPWRA
jgi:lantibiotic modifying enzyme